MLPDLRDVLATLRVVELPLRQRFRGIDARQVALFQGPLGWTEFSPFREYDAHESSTWLAAAYDFGWSEPPPPRRERVGVNATVPAVGPDGVAAILATFPGCRTVKVKVAEPGQSLADDVARVSAVRNLIGPDAAIRIDANGSWSVDAAEHAIVALAPLGLDYVEQPCASVSDLAQLRSRIAGLGVLVAADESIRKADDPELVARSRAADIMVIKAQPLGGIHRALEVVDRVGLPAVVSSALDTSVGLAMGAHLAAALPEPRDAGLGTAALLAADVTRDPLLPVEGSIEVRRVDVDSALVQKFAADPDTAAWWHERVTVCHHLLAETGSRRRPPGS